MNLLRYVLIAAVLSSTASYAMAEVTRIEIATRADVLAGKGFGDTGPYEEIVGKVYYSLDPDNPRNKSIADLDKAPRDAAGRVAFVADLFVLAPKDKSHGNGVALFDVLNRGRKNMLNAFNRSLPSFDPNAPLDLGDGFLMQQGYTLVWVGWQFDLPHRGSLMGLEAPPVLENGKPVVGKVTTTFTPNTNDPTYPLNDVGRYADTTHYPPVDPASPANMLVVRDGFLGAPHVIPRDEWQFARVKDGQIVPDSSAVYLKAGFQPGHFYELSYQATGASSPVSVSPRCGTSLPRSSIGRTCRSRRVTLMRLAHRRTAACCGSSCTRASMPTSRTAARRRRARRRFQLTFRPTKRPWVFCGVTVSLPRS